MTTSAKPVMTALTVSCLLLATWSAYLMFAPLSAIEVPEAALPPRTSLNVKPVFFTPPPIASFAAINERPLFSPMRKPITADDVATGATAGATMPTLTLVGVILAGDTKIAVLKSSGAPFAKSVRLGEEIDGWELSEVTPEKAVLRTHGTANEIRMNTNQPGSATQPAPPSPVSPTAPIRRFKRQGAMPPPLPLGDQNSVPPPPAQNQ